MSKAICIGAALIFTLTGVTLWWAGEDPNHMLTLGAIYNAALLVIEETNK